MGDKIDDRVRSMTQVAQVLRPCASANIFEFHASVIRSAVCSEISFAAVIAHEMNEHVARLNSDRLRLLMRLPACGCRVGHRPLRHGLLSPSTLVANP